ncbi:alpha/beta hydrolase [Vibrio metschnikovii]|uniref:alpha/beta hydrolase n=1 Tax=Vibrio metschnikovii TaxID=28172 RepID=UPI002FC75BB6
MIDKILVIPGYKGSPNGHWQTWLQTQYPNTERIKAIDHHKPILSQWSAQIQQYLEQQTLPIIIVAHSFGCLAALDAIARKQLQSKVSGPRIDSLLMVIGLIFRTNVRLLKR